MGSYKHTQQDFDDEMNDLELGLQKELTCRDFYQQAAEQVVDSHVKALYSWLANAVSLRISGLQAIRQTAQGSQEWMKGLDAQIKEADAAAGEAPQFDPSTGGKPGRAEVTTLRQAIELEKESASIYFTAARRSREPNIREFYRYLGPAEERHKQLLESYFDGLIKLAVKR
ncbi:MAG: hypothetical protein M5U01_39935 [Ardenticatenaceae bacterium]|nr:hypothetical protein [Ardenticatenaceae bacterium]